ncbi:MAG: helix-turn-helix domain-containing protein [Proteobacteria bacterium]|nr:helix-turn-helix domain-containing protein [Pseudomonadota bacterium]MBU4260171.1 helix-turn-helix domain-containing protein [Pseudomonadota bacterium]MBU4288473.1 helix-turn-helix domain-containing protein [Pseudomonadota bacterium]MCG2759180.1 helix-turn-helix domain-containing protein [Desulfobacteraceae bacterium]
MIKITEIAEKANITQGALSNILSGRRRPSWTVAKRLAQVTYTTPYLWLEGMPDEIKSALKNFKPETSD